MAKIEKVRVLIRLCIKVLTVLYTVLQQLGAVVKRFRRRR